MKQVFHHKYKAYQKEITTFISDFNKSGKQLKAARNTIKLFTLSTNDCINIKSFKVPNIINQVVYSFFRKSKALRSFEYANRLIALNVGTPEPIAYYKSKKLFLFKESFYVSKQLQYDLTYRELTTNLNYPDHENIVRAFVRFTHSLHEKGIHFLDHSPGNTLIKKTHNGYSFYLVDLNRMRFETMNMQMRLHNFSRLTKNKAIIEIMSDEYSKCTGLSNELVFNDMYSAIKAFHYKFERKKRLKKRFKIT